MSPISMRVAHSDWCASRSVVSVMWTGRIVDLPCQSWSTGRRAGATRHGVVER